jgi:hypothetical protein
MKRKDYQKPTTRVVLLKHQCHILSGSPYETTGSGKTKINEMDDEVDL